MIDLKKSVKLTGLRQVTHLSRDGEYVRSAFALIGDNVEWAAPEIISQVSFLCTRLGSLYINLWLVL